MLFVAAPPLPFLAGRHTSGISGRSLRNMVPRKVASGERLAAKSGTHASRSTRVGSGLCSHRGNEELRFLLLLLARIGVGARFLARPLTVDFFLFFLWAFDLDLRSLLEWTGPFLYLAGLVVEQLSLSEWSSVLSKDKASLVAFNAICVLQE